MKSIDYVALLSTINFLWTISRETPKVQVKLVSGSDRLDGELISGIYIVVQNPSIHILHISNILILIPHKQSSIKDLIHQIWQFKRIPRNNGWAHMSLADCGLNTGCPFSLDAGKSHRVFIPDQTLKAIFENAIREEIMCVVQDEVRKGKYSKKFKYQINI